MNALPMIVFIVLMSVSCSYSQYSPKKDTSSITSKSKEELDTFILGKQNRIALSSDSIAFRSQETDITKLKDDHLRLILREVSKPNIPSYIIPVLIFILGGISGRFWNSFDEIRTIKRKGRRWWIELQRLYVATSNHVGKLKEFNDAMKKESMLTVIGLPYESMLDCKVFTSLNENDLIESLEFGQGDNLRTAINITQDIRSALSLIPKNNEQIIASYNTYKTNYSAIHAQFVTSMNNFLKQIGHSITVYPIKFGFITELIETHILPYKDSGEYDLYALETKFLTPIRLQLESEPQNSTVSNLFVHLVECEKFIRKIKVEKGYLTEIIDKISGFYLENTKLLNTSIDQLRQAQKVSTLRVLIKRMWLSITQYKIR